MALNSIDGSLGGGLLPIAKASRRKLVMMQGELTGLSQAAATSGCLTNGTASEGDTSFAVDTVDATTKFAVGDKNDYSHILQNMHQGDPVHSRAD